MQQPQGGQGTLAGANITVAANNKASQAAQAPKKVTNTSNNVGFQQNQMAQKQGNVKAATVQKTGGMPARASTTGTQGTTIESYFNALRDRKEHNKQLDEKSSDWRSELKEALGKDDEVFHPYVEVMPFKDFKQNEVKKNMVKGVLEKGAAENPAQATAKAGLLKMGDEPLEERVYMQPRGAERKREEKEDKKRKAEAAKDAVRHARVTKGIPGYDAKGKYYLKNGKKVYENAD